MPSPGNVQDKFCGTRATVDSGLMNVRALFRQLTKSNIPHHRQICRWVSPTQHQLQLTHTSESRWQSLLRFSRGLVRGITAPRDEEATAVDAREKAQCPLLVPSLIGDAVRQTVYSRAGNAILYHHSRKPLNRGGSSEKGTKSAAV